MTILKLTRRSICPCGYSTIKDEIQLGTSYTVDLSSKRDGFTYICGGCGMTQLVFAVRASCVTSPSLPLAFIPFDLFTPNLSDIIERIITHN